MSSIQWESVARIPAVVALKVIASPLKSMPLIPLGVTSGNTKNTYMRSLIAALNQTSTSHVCVIFEDRLARKLVLK